MRKKPQICITISDKTNDKMEELMQALPKKVIGDNKLQRITKSSIIELYSEIIHNYFDLNQLSMEYEMLDIVDGRRKI